MASFRNAAALGLLGLFGGAFCGVAAQVVSTSKQTYHQPADDPGLRALLAQAQSATEKKDYAAAARAYTQYLAQKPDDAPIHFQLGYVYSAANDSERAAAEYRKAIALNPKMVEAYQNLGLTLLEEDPAAALEPLRKMIELAPNEPRPKFLLGLALERSGQLPSAIEQYQAAEKLDPNSFDIHFAIGRSSLAAQLPAPAEAEFRKALALQPDSAVAHLGLAHSLAALKKPEEAAAALGAYLSLQPQDAAARLDRASLLLDLGKPDEALAEIDRVDAAGPPTLASLKLRADIFFQEKKFGEAAEALKKAEPLAPQDAELHAHLGRALLDSQDYHGAAKELSAALSLNPRLTDALKDLVAAEYLDKNYPITLAVLDELAKRESPTVGFWFIRATCYDRLDKKAEALDAYKRFLELNAGQTNDQYFEATGRARLLARELKEKK
jgi:tetratricopeptide (TPR) repeat protein